MMELLNNIRIPIKKNSFFKDFILSCLFLLGGLIAGVISKYLDIYTSNLGNIFSQMSVWIFICTMISIYSNTAKRAAINVFLFCIGMLLAYYITAEITNSIYSEVFAFGWLAFGLFSPIFGFFTWYAKGKGIFSQVLSIGIILVMLIIAIVLFDKIRIEDVLFAVLLCVFLFK